MPTGSNIGGQSGPSHDVGGQHGTGYGGSGSHVPGGHGASSSSGPDAEIPFHAGSTAIDVSKPIPWNKGASFRQLGNHPVVRVDFDLAGAPPSSSSTDPAKIQYGAEPLDWCHSTGEPGASSPPKARAKVVVKFQGIASTIGEVLLARLAAKLGFKTAAARILPRDEANALVDRLREKGGSSLQSTVVGAHDKGSTTGTFAMDYLEGENLGTEASRRFANKKAYEQIGKLMAFQLFTNGADRFIMPWTAATLRSDNIRLDQDGVQAIDNTIAQSVTTDKVYNLSDDPQEYAKQYQHLIKKAVDAILEGSKRDPITRPNAKAIAQALRVPVSEVEGPLLEGLQQGLGDIAALTTDFRELVQSVRDGVPAESLEISAEAAELIGKLSESMREKMKKEFLEGLWGVAKGDNVAIFLEAMRRFLAERVQKANDSLCVIM